MQYRRHDNHKSFCKGIYGMLKNRGELITKETFPYVTIEDIREWKKELEQLNIPQRILKLQNANG